MGSSYGRVFRIMTFGESHGLGIGVVIEGVPSLLDLSEEDIQKDLDRRRPGQSHITNARKESDTAIIYSGVFEGKTTGAPIGVIIQNKDQRSKDYGNLKNVFRPGHADYSFYKKYGIRDYRGGGRSSGRETACRVIAGAIAKKVLECYGIQIIAYTKSVGPIVSNPQQYDYEQIEKNKVRCPDKDAAKKMEDYIASLQQESDSTGGVIEAVIQGCPAGLGEPVFDKVDAVIAHALMSIGTIKGIEFGQGFHSATMKGSDHNDTFLSCDEKLETQENYAGGILGGITTGEDITLRVAVKPASSIAKLQSTINKNNEACNLQVVGRHDPCICPRAIPVIEAMIAIGIADLLCMQKGIHHTHSLS